ncbi:MAG: OmpA family protein [Myxococcota bacterium]
MSRLWLTLAVVGIGCTNPRIVAASLAKAEQQLKAANDMHARQCAPVELAEATSNYDFAKLEFMQGDVRRASEHLKDATRAGAEALTVATPCGSKDADEDGIADVIDRCPNEKEDLDGDADEDGCRDIRPDGDEDLDNIKNIDDACIDDAEDMDGDADEDGCPETSRDGDGDQIIDAVDKCPDDPEDIDGWEDEDGCPDYDNDGDAITDLLDGCPTLREDIDGWDDTDGCPDLDNDGDGVPDTTDACPDETGDRFRSGCPLDDADQDGISDANDLCADSPETVNDYLDTDGCPDTPPTLVRVTRQAIEPLEPITFVSGKATIASGSGVVDEVARVLKDAPSLSVRIEGHTDSEGEDAANLGLSERRANTVRIALIRLGIDGNRLTAEGFGEQRPVDTNRTAAGRARNRRVSFVIIDN